MMDSLLTIFDDVQRSKRSHKTHAKKINTIVDNNKAGSTKNAKQHQSNPILLTLLNGILDQTLLFPKSNPNIARVLDFFSTLAASSGEILQAKLLDHLYQRLRCTNKVVRQRACQILEGFMTILVQEQLELDQDTIEEFMLNVLQRLGDKIPTIRISAVEALKHLQDVTNENCEIIEQFLFMIENDETSSVRNAVTKNIALCDQTMPAIVKRVRDIKSEVRVSALNRFIEGAGTGTDIRQFSKDLRLEIVNAGLNDRDAEVRAATEKLLLRWLALLQNDVSKLFSYLAPTENEETVYLVGAALAERVFSENADHSFELLKSMAPNWNAHLSSIAATDLLWVYLKCKYCSLFYSKFELEAKFSERVLPEAGRFCQLLSTPYDEKNHLHFKYLLLLVPFVSRITDPSGSNKLLSKLVDMILDSEGDCDLIDQLLLAFWTISIKDNKTSDYAAVRKLMDYVRKLIQDDLSNMSGFSMKKYRAALIVKWIFQNNHYNKDLMEEGVQFILDSLQQPHVELRAVSFSSLSVLCIVDTEIRKKYQGIIKNVALAEIVEDISVRAQAIQGLLDLCLVAGEDSESFSPTDRIDIDSAIAKLMDSEHPELKAIAMEGSVKLLFSGFSSDPNMVSKLLKFFFIGDEKSVDDEDEEAISTSRRMQQILSVFLQTFLANEQSCLEVVRLSISLFISEFTTSIRDEQTEATTLALVFNNLFGICERVLETAQELATKSRQDEDKSLLHKMKTSFAYLKETAAACLCRELLKLGTDKIDKKICKEFIKVLGTLTIQWITSTEAESVRLVLRTIKDFVSMDKASAKIIEALLGEVVTGDHSLASDESARVSFYDCAPGLKDLVRIGQHDWDEPSQMDTSQLRRSPRKRTNRKPLRDSDEENDDENDAISEEIDEDNEEDDDIGELPPSCTKVKHLSSR